MGPARARPAGVPPTEDLGDPAAAVFYSAQSLLQKTVGVAHRPGNVKKGGFKPGTFSTTQRADLNEKL